MHNYVRRRPWEARSMHNYVLQRPWGARSMNNYVLRRPWGARSMHNYGRRRPWGARSMRNYMVRRPWGARSMHNYVLRRPWGARSMHNYCSGAPGPLWAPPFEGGREVEYGPSQARLWSAHCSYSCDCFHVVNHRFSKSTNVLHSCEVELRKHWWRK